MIAYSALIFALGIAAQPLPTAAPATPFPGTAVTPLPAATGMPAPQTPAPAPSASATAAATAPAQPTAPAGTPLPFTYRFVPRQPDKPAPGQPQIFAVYLNSKTLVSQGPIEIKVTTDPGTVKVTSRSNGREGIIPMIAPGDFEAYSKLPKIPFIAAGMSVQLEFTAVSADGRKVSVRVPVALK